MPTTNVNVSFAGDQAGTPTVQWSINGPVNADSNLPGGWSVSPRYTRQSSVTMQVTYPSNAPNGTYTVNVYTDQFPEHYIHCCGNGPFYSIAYGGLTINQLGCTRYVCDDDGSCHPIADYPCDQGYADEASCIAGCRPNGGWWVCSNGSCLQDPYATSGYHSSTDCYAGGCGGGGGGGGSGTLPDTLCVVGTAYPELNQQYHKQSGFYHGLAFYRSDNDHYIYANSGSPPTWYLSFTLGGYPAATGPTNNSPVVGSWGAASVSVCTPADCNQMVGQMRIGFTSVNGVCKMTVFVLGLSGANGAIDPDTCTFQWGGSTGGYTLIEPQTIQYDLTDPTYQDFHFSVSVYEGATGCSITLNRSILAPSGACTANRCITDAGTNAVRGNYVKTTVANHAADAYIGANYSFYWNEQTEYWGLIPNGATWNQRLYQATGYPDELPTGEWTVLAGTAPGPSIYYGTCGPDGGGDDCNLDGHVEIEDLGEGNYRARAVLTGATSGAAATWMRNGEALSSEGALTALFSLAEGASATIAATVTDGDCEWAGSANATNGGGGGGGEDECCEPGFYRATEGGPCLPIPTGAAPIVPTAPTLAKSCSAQTLTVTCPAFPATATTVELQREGSDEVVHTFTTAGDWVDTDAGLASHRYRLRSCNEVGCSTWGAWSVALGLASALVPIWVTPAQDSAGVGTVSLVASAGPPSGLYGTSPVTMKLFGGELPVTYDAASGHWLASFDSNLEYQGTIEITLQARDSSGCYSFPIALHLELDNSIERGTHWSEKALDAGVTAEMAALGEVMTHTGYYARVLTGGEPDLQRYFRWYVISPDPGAATLSNLADDAFMQNRVANWQSAALNDVTRLITPAVTGATAPNHTARLAMQSVPCEAMNLFDLHAGHVLKLRQTADDTAQILTTDNWQEFGPDGLSVVCNFADYGVDDVVDGARIESKIYLAQSNSSRIVIIDTTAGKISGAVAPWQETRFCTALENWNGKLFAVYSDASSATGYVLEGGSFDDPVVLTAGITRAWVRGGSLYLATSQRKLLAVASDGALTTLREHNQDITALEILPNGTATATELGDAGGAAYSLSNGTASLLASGLSGPIADLGRFKGAALAPRGALVVSSGTHANTVFFKTGTVYSPRWSLQDLEGHHATKAVGLARLVITLRPASGDPLMGGDPGLFAEWLLVAFETSGGAYLARIQEADVDISQVTKGRAVTRQNFKRARAIPKPLPTTENSS